jgi:hypothetical protein
MGQPNHIEPAYAKLRVAEFDSQIKGYRESIKALQERRKKFEPFLATANDDKS